MAEHTHISWADSTLNIWAGCTKVSPACDGCYAEHLMDTRMGRVTWGPHGERVEMKGWRTQLHKIAKLARAHFLRTGKQWFVFVNSLSDFFDNQADPAWRAEALTAFARVPEAIFLLLTKRPQNIAWMVQDLRADLPPNCAIGTTIEDRKRLEINSAALALAAKALNPAFTFWSCEPLMEDLGDLFGFPMPDWIITGGASDQGAWKAPPTHTDWYRNLRDQAAVTGTAYHHKQNGEWLGGVVYTEGATSGLVRHQDDSEGQWGGFQDHWWDGDAFGGTISTRVGKKAAGRLLDGVEHNVRPEVRT